MLQYPSLSFLSLRFPQCLSLHDPIISFCLFPSYCLNRCGFHVTHNVSLYLSLLSNQLPLSLTLYVPLSLCLSLVYLSFFIAYSLSRWLNTDCNTCGDCQAKHTSYAGYILVYDGRCDRKHRNNNNNNTTARLFVIIANIMVIAMH